MSIFPDLDTATSSHPQRIDHTHPTISQDVSIWMIPTISVSKLHAKHPAMIVPKPDMMLLAYEGGREGWREGEKRER